LNLDDCFGKILPDWKVKYYILTASLNSFNRNLNVTEDDDQDKDADENGGDIISGLHCKIVVQFEKHRDFYNALKVLCGRSLQKVGT